MKEKKREKINLKFSNNTMLVISAKIHFTESHFFKLQSIKLKETNTNQEKSFKTQHQFTNGAQNLKLKRNIM